MNVQPYPYPYGEPPWMMTGYPGMMPPQATPEKSLLENPVLRWLLVLVIAFVVFWFISRLICPSNGKSSNPLCTAWNQFNWILGQTWVWVVGGVLAGLYVISLVLKNLGIDFGPIEPPDPDPEPGPRPEPGPEPDPDVDPDVDPHPDVP